MGAILWTWKRLHPGAISAPLFSFSAVKEENTLEFTFENRSLFKQGENIKWVIYCIHYAAKLGEEDKVCGRNITSCQPTMT